MSDVKYPGGTLGGVPLFNDENREFVTATNAWRDVPIPRKMRALGKDRRGYPIPFNLLRNEEGRLYDDCSLCSWLFRMWASSQCG